jgi:hypothetical protein
VAGLCVVPSWLLAKARVSSPGAPQDRLPPGRSLARVAVPARLPSALLSMAVLIFLVCLALDQLKPV